MALESYCAACTYLGERCDYNGKYYCSRRGDVYACDPKCYNFCEAYSRSNSARQNMFDNSRGHQSGGGCYITTMLCQVLNYPDNNYYMQVLRQFRDTYMKETMINKLLLLEYDIIGPKIAEKIKSDDNKLPLSKMIFNNYIIPAVGAVENKKNEDAKDIYVSMTKYLANMYEINNSIISPEDINFINEETLGHARIRKPKTIY